MWFVAGGISVQLVASCDEYEPPATPDMSDAIAAYEEPTGVLDGDSVSNVLSRVVEDWQTARQRAPIELANALIDDLTHVDEAHPEAHAPDTEDAGMLESEPAKQASILGHPINVAAHATVQRICPGWGPDAAIDRDASGWADLIAKVDEHGVIPIAWGQLHHCRFDRERISLELDGEVRLVFGDGKTRVQFNHLRDYPYLFFFDGKTSVRVGSSEQSDDTKFSFRLFTSGDVEWSVSLIDGTNVVAVFDPLSLLSSFSDPMLSLGVNTRDNDWRCQVALSDNQGSCSSEQDPTRAVAW